MTREVERGEKRLATFSVTDSEPAYICLNKPFSPCESKFPTNRHTGRIDLSGLCVPSDQVVLS